MELKVGLNTKNSTNQLMNVIAGDHCFDPCSVKLAPCESNIRMLYIGEEEETCLYKSPFEIKHQHSIIWKLCLVDE